MTKARRALVDSAEGAAQTHLNVAAGPPKLPAHLELTKEAMVFWDDIMRARAYDEWGRIELVLAWQLAWVQCDIKEQRALVASGDRERLENAGFPSVRAASMNIGILMQQQLKLMAALRITGAVAGDPPAVFELPRRKAEREAEQTTNRLRLDTPSNVRPLLAL